MEHSNRLLRFLVDNETSNVYSASSRSITQTPTVTNFDPSHSSSVNIQIEISPTASPDSDGSSDAQSDSILSRRSSGSSATSAATSVDTMSTAEWEAGHILPCIFHREANCSVLFHRSNVDDWISHSESHYRSHRADPPKHALCVYCNESFAAENPYVCWRNRMNHIAEHLLAAVSTKQRPDFGVAKHMVENKCITQDHYDEYSKESERPRSNGLRAANYIPAERQAEMEAAEEAQNRVVINLSRSEKCSSRFARSQQRRGDRKSKVNTQAV